MSSGASEWAVERTNERSGAREQSELCGTSCTKARAGHRYPCPALVFCNGSSFVSRAAAFCIMQRDCVIQNESMMSGAHICMEVYTHAHTQTRT